MGFVGHWMMFSFGILFLLSERREEEDSKIGVFKERQKVCRDRCYGSGRGRGRRGRR